MDVLAERRLACLRVYCQFYFIYADPKCIGALSRAQVEWRDVQSGEAAGLRGRDIFLPAAQKGER